MLERSNYHAAALVMVAELSEQKSDEYFGSVNFLNMSIIIPINSRQ